MIFFRQDTGEIIIRTTDVQTNMTLDAVLPVHEAEQFVKEMTNGINSVKESITIH